MFEKFEKGVANVNDVHIPYVKGGSGPALLLLHGHPQTKAIWHKVAPQLAERFTVVASDLRGYGDASKPEGTPNHYNYSKREMARDQVTLMQSLGLPEFDLVGHDRGGRVAHRLAADHPGAVKTITVLDICPTLAMYEQTNMEFASAYWHWFFLIQPAPFPETLINQNPEFYFSKLMGNRSAGLSPFTEQAWNEYIRCARDPKTIHGMCEDYRASATIDLTHDRADREIGRRLKMPFQVLWGKNGVIEKCFKPLQEWQRVAIDVRGHALDCGHYIPEEAPEALLAALNEFI
jgi:haloacetate dehalogenase